MSFFAINPHAGIDKIPAKVVKDCKMYIVDQLANLINCSLQTCTFPSAWKLAEVIPLMQNDLDAEKGPNNRPISLLPILSKLCERVPYFQLMTFLTGRGKLSKHQSGNKKLYSAETLNILTTDYIIDQMDKKYLTAMVLIDLSSISHDILLQKLIKFDISSSAIKWFKSYLEERFQSVRIANHLSDPRLITHGVPTSYPGSFLYPSHRGKSLGTRLIEFLKDQYWGLFFLACMSMIYQLYPSLQIWNRMLMILSCLCL